MRAAYEWAFHTMRSLRIYAAQRRVVYGRLATCHREEKAAASENIMHRRAPFFTKSSALKRHCVNDALEAHMLW